MTLTLECLLLTDSAAGPRPLNFSLFPLLAQKATASHS